MATILSECREIAKRLAARNCKVVFAESCTGGLVSASLARIPGISDHLCGSAVTYRNATKQEWLNVPTGLLADPGPVSEPVARAMAAGVLSRTSEADLAVSVTGHLGPSAPAGLDGIVFIGVARRHGRKCVTHVHRVALQTRSRSQRQQEAAKHVLEFLKKALS